MKKYNYIIYHKNCLDGFASFVILFNSKTIATQHHIFPDVPSAKSVPLNISDKDVIIMDVAYSYEILKQIMLLARSVTFIDHHVTIHDDVKKIYQEIKSSSNKEIVIIYDKLKSGCALTWEFLYQTKPPLFVRLIEDNDTGRWKMPHIFDFISALSVKYNINHNKSTLKQWSKLTSIKEINKLISLGIIYNQYKDHLVDSSYKRISIEQFPSEAIFQAHPTLFDKPGQYKCAVYNGSPCPNASDLAKRIFKEFQCDFFMSWVYNLDRKEYVLVFRSERVDVGSIAKIFNGGGHTLAAAASIKDYMFNIVDLFFGKSLDRK
jgi:oligoribonuclease NrnB/cAMP/cGMP phosphodiesterase (DHH superfamily)